MVDIGTFFARSDLDLLTPMMRRTASDNMKSMKSSKGATMHLLIMQNEEPCPLTPEYSDVLPHYNSW